MNCIIVEDEFMIALSIKIHLKKSGFETLSIIDTEKDAIASILQLKPDFVIIDENLKHGGSGLNVYQACKSKIDIPFLFISGGSNETLQKIQHYKCPFLTKPFLSKDLIEFVNTHTLSKTSHQT